MIDYLKIKILFVASKSVLQRVNYPVLIFGIEFDPVMRKGIVVRYIAKLGNLHLSVRENELTIQNSVHKFYHGNNYMSFTVVQLQHSIILIENILGISIRTAKIISFEFGVVIEDNNIAWTLSRLGYYKGKPPIPMHANGVIEGTMYTNSTHRLKIYSKTAEIKRREGIKLDKEYLRIEKFYSRAHIQSLSCLRHNPIITLEDLISWKTLEILAQDLVVSLLRIELKPIPKDIEQLSSMNLRRWCYYQDPYFRSVMKKYHPKAFKTDRREINLMIQKYRENGQDYMIQEVRNKLAFCFAN